MPCLRLSGSTNSRAMTPTWRSIPAVRTRSITARWECEFVATCPMIRPPSSATHAAEDLGPSEIGEVPLRGDTRDNHLLPERGVPGPQARLCQTEHGDEPLASPPFLPEESDRECWSERAAPVRRAGGTESHPRPLVERLATAHNDYECVGPSQCSECQQLCSCWAFSACSLAEGAVISWYGSLPALTTTTTTPTPTTVTTIVYLRAIDGSKGKTTLVYITVPNIVGMTLASGHHFGIPRPRNRWCQPDEQGHQRAKRDWDDSRSISFCRIKD